MAFREVILGEERMTATAVERAPGVVPIEVERVKRTRVGEVDFANLRFGTVYADHMVLAEFTDGAWGPVRIQPYGPLSLPPSVTSLHYGLSVFEGMKAHRSPGGRPLLFRPELNARRFQRSALRLAMPPVPESTFLESLRRLLCEDRDWLPPHGQGALYIRPLLFSNDPVLGVRPAERFLFTIFTTPFTSFFAAPVDVLVTDRYVRAFPGGTGDVKPAANYAGPMLAQQEAKQAGYHAVLWLDAEERRYVEECGVMNVFAVFGDRILTPPLSGTILPGVTRDSVITLLRDMGHTVEEKRFAIDELFAAGARDDLRECFGTGTAATVTSIRRITRGKETLELPPIEDKGFAASVRDRLVGIMDGRDRDPYGWVEVV